MTGCRPRRLALIVTLNLYINAQPSPVCYVTSFVRARVNGTQKHAKHCLPRKIEIMFEKKCKTTLRRKKKKKNFFFLASQALGIVDHPRNLVYVPSLDGEQFGTLLFLELRGNDNGMMMETDRMSERDSTG